ncbi:LytR/AlgR family response regulator transcription factor [Oceanirhabdus sp. W0125-5]|uniref:LytR/AlgR family response regulator transcription factor n=1 Tax=Oceanirhabdus sp. W0125-5 TaxID=2999116 RepID=UPI0022F30DB7|nr:LytTR family DNA-binding domain-containing protein [Oceanirhabdus sp. W0125-5]WBW96530.1 LytTR family DNA-binding domain-containing protein [Oceanirhabdus sp. W0125-5]
MNSIIIDDEFPSREELKFFIENFSSIKIVGEFESPIEALAFLDKEKVDVVFLDINMPNIDGMTLGKIISNKSKEIKIIFITAHKQYAVEAFELEAFDYILKPYSKERIVNLLKKLERVDEKGAMGDILSVWKGEKIVILKCENICYCEAVEGHTIVHTSQDEYVVNSSLSQLFKKLGEEQFFRTHRAFIVNMRKIEEITPWFNNTFMLRLTGIDKEIPVSRNNISEFKHLMGI